MRRRRIVLAAALIAVLAGCVPRYGVSTSRDDFAGRTVHRMRGNVLADPDGGGEWIELNVEVSRGRASAPDLSLALLYRDTSRWLWVPYGESLQILADRELIVLNGTGSFRSRRRSPLGVEERVMYPISPDQLRRIVSADTVRLRILGRREYVERRFSDKGRLRLREFVKEQFDESTAPGPNSAPTGSRQPQAAPLT
ncbi:MAG: hypothetical protein ABW277_15650 [Longimicrobiaceae bacterium]